MRDHSTCLIYMFTHHTANMSGKLAANKYGGMASVHP